MARQGTRRMSVRPARPWTANDPKGDRVCQDHAGIPSQPLSRNFG